MEYTYKDAEYYTDKIRRKVAVDKVAMICKLPDLTSVKDNYEVHLFVDGHAGVFNRERYRYLKPSIGDKRSRYFKYQLSTKDGSVKRLYLHRLIGLAFIDGYEEGYFIDHKDCDSLNCHITNLEWVSHKENTQRAVKNGLGVGRPRVPKKPKIYKSKLERSASNSKQLNYDDVTKIFSLARKGLTRTEIAKHFGVSQPAISQIFSGVRWSEHEESKKYRGVG
ncbi:HNH endonuclease [Gracilibacillus caseinilyticus]|uniref:HNH endonuclease n=1 Tax=Gracilibacillus caseinilyticus TaxID=2932256 RepID=A0ABY4ETV4_9BACI|nr:HNH endonuclease [Gracilibacillus caseinilyticus]UOQ47760.1 HNH endonuclease [Gracilibacillus caseinilyticus]